MSCDFGFLPIPRRLRYEEGKPKHFGLAVNMMFGLAAAFTSANVYYCQPLLIEFSKTFGVSYDEVSHVPTLVQAGYATGIVLIAPLGDLVRRRPLMLLLLSITTLLTTGLAFTSNLAVFEVLSYFIGVFTVVPQILVPLTADLVPVERRGAALAIVFAGLDSGNLYARVIGGVVAQYAPARVMYMAAIGIQLVVLLSMWAVVPDYPAKNPELSYLSIVGDMGMLVMTEPVLVQASLILLLAAACFSAFWVTLSFLLSGAPFFFPSLDIGLFGLVGLVGVVIAPFTGRLVDRLVPWHATLVGIIGYMVFQAVQVGAGGLHIAAVVIACVGLDLFFTMTHISLTTSVFGIDPAARARLNSVLIAAIFVGQALGSSVSTILFTRYGWRAAAGFALGLTGLELLAIVVRGPYCRRNTWFGYEDVRRQDASHAAEATMDIEKAKASNISSVSTLSLGLPELPREQPPHLIEPCEGPKDLDS